MSKRGAPNRFGRSILMERLRQHPLVISPCVPPSHLSLSVYKKTFHIFFAIWRYASVWYNNNSYRRTNRPCHTMGGHKTQVFLTTPIPIRLECPVSVVLHGNTLEWIAVPRSRPSAQARRSEKTRTFWCLSLRNGRWRTRVTSIPACSQPSNKNHLHHLGLWIGSSACAAERYKDIMVTLVFVRATDDSGPATSTRTV